jgi:hypothetical protein
MKKNLLLLLAMLLAALMAACSGDAIEDVNNPMETQAALKVLVRDAITNEPVDGAEVTLMGASKSSITKDGGFAEFENVYVGKHQLQIKAEGYANANVEAEIDKDYGTYGDGSIYVAKQGLAQVKIYPLAKLEGSLFRTDENGNSVAAVGATVKLDYSSCTDLEQNAYFTDVAADGKYAFDVPVCGSSYNLTVMSTLVDGIRYKESQICGYGFCQTLTAGTTTQRTTAHIVTDAFSEFALIECTKEISLDGVITCKFSGAIDEAKFKDEMVTVEYTDDGSVYDSYLGYVEFCSNNSWYCESYYPNFAEYYYYLGNYSYPYSLLLDARVVDISTDKKQLDIKPVGGKWPNDTKAIQVSFNGLPPVKGTGFNGNATIRIAAGAPLTGSIAGFVKKSPATIDAATPEVTLEWTHSDGLTASNYVLMEKCNSANSYSEASSYTVPAISSGKVSTTVTFGSGSGSYEQTGSTYSCSEYNYTYETDINGNYLGYSQTPGDPIYGEKYMCFDGTGDETEESYWVECDDEDQYDEYLADAGGDGYKAKIVEDTDTIVDYEPDTYTCRYWEYVPPTPTPIGTNECSYIVQATKNGRTITSSNSVLIKAQ